MTTNFKLTDKIGDIVAIFPGAASLFMDNRIDFCCGGNRPLEEAIENETINKEDLLKELNIRHKEFKDKEVEFIDWARETPTKLIRHVVDTHHNYLNNELPRISELVLKILQVHGLTHPELFKVHELYNALRTELEGHLVKEERIIFPAIMAYEKDKTDKGRDSVLALIEELEAEHEAAGDIIKELQKLTNYHTPPADGCGTFVLTYQKLKDLEIDTFEHIHLENNILFKNL